MVYCVAKTEEIAIWNESLINRIDKDYYRNQFYEMWNNKKIEEIVYELNQSKIKTRNKQNKAIACIKRIVRRIKMVSLIIPCYNAEKYIGRCLDSVLNQTDRNIELIVVNDGSTDKTARIIEDYRHVLESDITRFIYISQENEGVGAACNNALKKVTGEFLTLLDADDIMLPESIEIRRKWLEEHSTYGLVRTNGYYVTEDNLELCNRLLEVNEYMKNKENVFNELFNGTTYLWPGTYMIRMNVLDKLYPDREIYPSRNGQNMQLVMMAAYVSKAGFIDIPLMKYVLQKESLSHFSSGNVMQKS